MFLDSLSLMVDGLDAVDLGVLGTSQYALAANRADMWDAHTVWRRNASEVGTYGGWRYECSGAHAIQYDGASELHHRIAFAVQEALDWTGAAVSR